MGWSSGTRLMGAVIQELNKQGIPTEVRKTVYTILIPAMEEADWDNQEECAGVDAEYDEALFALHPSWKEDNPDDLM